VTLCTVCEFAPMAWIPASRLPEPAGMAQTAK
jgi:hypothetical protein